MLFCAGFGAWLDVLGARSNGPITWKHRRTAWNPVRLPRPNGPLPTAFFHWGTVGLGFLLPAHHCDCLPGSYVKKVPFLRLSTGCHYQLFSGEEETRAERPDRLVVHDRLGWGGAGTSLGLLHTDDCRLYRPDYRLGSGFRPGIRRGAGFGLPCSPPAFGWG